MAKSRQIAKEIPKWLRKIDIENAEAAQRDFQAFCEFVIAKLDFESEIDEINEKYGSKFAPQDMFTVSQEQEQLALDFFEGPDDDDDDD